MYELWGGVVTDTHAFYVGGDLENVPVCQQKIDTDKWIKFRPNGNSPSCQACWDVIFGNAPDMKLHICEICKGPADHKTSRHPWPSRLGGVDDWLDKPHAHGGTDRGGGEDCPARAGETIEDAPDVTSPPTAPVDERRELLVDSYLMTESEYEKFKEAVQNSGPIYDSDPIYKIVAEIIKNRCDELY